MKRVKSLGAVLIASVFLVVLAGCQKDEGPAEKAGKNMDEAAESLGKKVEEAGEAMQDKAKGD